MTVCSVCGSHFASKRCYFCQKYTCTSCVISSDVTGRRTTKCVTCERRGVTKISALTVVRRNKVVFGILGGFWLFAVFPFPFLDLGIYSDEVLMSILQPVLMVTALMTIPFVLMLIAWQKRSPG